MLNSASYRMQPLPLFVELDRNHPHRFLEEAVWECMTLCTGERTIISGPLAQVVEKYPDDFGLKLIAVPVLRRKD